MIYLVEFEAMNAAGAIVTARFATVGYVTSPADNPPNAYFEERVTNPGNFERSMFGSGRTTGDAEVGYGIIELANGDDGTGENLDVLATYAVDGRPLRIYGLERIDSPWSSRTIIFNGTMEQIEITWSTATIRIRDRLAELRKPIQELKYAGTTIAGGMNEAEGGKDDLKDRLKPMLWGTARNIPAVLANSFDLIYQVSSAALSGIQAVRDRGVPLTFGTNHATITALRTATIAGGQYHTCLALGLLRVAARPAGDLTVDATEGATGQRTASAVVQRILAAGGFFAGTDFSAVDFTALHAAAPQEVGIWIPTEARDRLTVITQLLASVGGYFLPDRLGVFRTGRLIAPTGSGFVIDRSLLIDSGDGVERVVTNDDGKGLPATKVTLDYAQSWLVQPAVTLDNTAVTDAIKSFVSLDARQAVAEDATVKVRHPLAPELSFITYLADATAAAAEATRRLGIYKVRRERYQAPLKTEIAAGIDLSNVVTLRVPRFGLDAGKPFVVIGIKSDLQAGLTTLDLWG